MRGFWCCLILFMHSLYAASNPLLFGALVEPLQTNAVLIEKLSNTSVMEPNKYLLRNFLSGVEGVMRVGNGFTNTNEVDKDALNKYLQELRTLSKTKESIDMMYKKSLNITIEKSDKQGFEELVSIPLEPLHQPRIRSEVIAFYQKNFPKNSIQNIEKLCDEQALEDKSIQYALEQEKAYEEHLRILKRSEVSKIKRAYKIGSRNSVLVVQERRANGDIVFEAENLNPYLVTLSLDFGKLINLKANQKLPFFIELAGKAKKEVIRLNPLTSSAVDYEATYGWVKGSAFAQHDDSYLYALPFAKGASVRVSQGYNGGLSHKGLSAYAIDFSLPIGTSLYAAREGEIVGIDVSSNLGGASSEYRPYMNYINIRHADGTLGNYYHLKQGGSVVKIGDYVKKGQLIGYSGNTGYCTAPHLHFSVSMVDPVSMRRPKNLPIKIQTLQGIVTNPREGDRYTVQ
ncbi:M23 family metallopeptidase [Sulfuricurvum sp.]|uniref:M23 family metallopeptidase n=1 Tax=Sulfuricurvum sp. TaxID=2025608 RepID=UPI003BB5DFDA